jgi:DNA invertase Pin-like site-specific DNA recombinase
MAYNTYGYSRVSTTEQATDRGSLEDQQRRIEGAAMIRGEAITRVFTDPGISGSVDLSQRPAGADLFAALRPGDVVIAAKMDRMFRSARDALATVERLRTRGVRLVLADMGTDPVTENGASKLFFTMLAAFAEFERTRIAERVTDGKRAKRAKGGHAGGSAPLGQRVVGTGREARLEEDPGEAALLARLRELREGGLSYEHTAVALEAEGYRGRTGKPLARQQLHRLLTRIAQAP